MQLHDFFGDGQAQTGALGLAGGLVAGLKKLVENVFLVGQRNALAVVGHGQGEVVGGVGRHRHPNAAGAVGRAGLDGVGEQVHQHLHQAVAVGGQGGQRGRHGHHQFNALVAQELAHGVHGFGQELGHGHGLAGQRGLARLELLQVQHQRNQAGEALGLAADGELKALPLGLVQVGVVGQNFGQRPDAGERGAQLVRHGVQKLVLAAVQHLQLGVGVAQVVGEALQLAALLLQLAVGFEQLLAFAQNAHHVVVADVLGPGHRGHQHPGAGRAQAAGQQLLGVGEQARVGRLGL